MAPGLSPAGRLRSRTSDLSDLLRGNQKAHPSDSMIPPVPSIPPSDGLVPAKSRRKLADFLNRKRKTSGVAPETASQKGDDDNDVAVPDAISQSRIPMASGSSSLPSSLPPLNVSPPSFGHAFPSSPPSGSPRLSTTTTDSMSSQPSRISHMPSLNEDRAPVSSSSQSRLKALRSQKTVSVEVSKPFNFTHTATASNMAMLNSVKGKAPAGKPTITVSEPPATEFEDDTSTYSSPRSAPTPPSSTTKSRPSREARKPISFGFSHPSKKGESSKRERTSTTPVPPEPSGSTKEKATPTPRASGSSIPSANSSPTSSPPLPSKMQFPVPPSSSSKLKQPSTSSLPTTRTTRERIGSQSTTRSVASSYRAPTSDVSESELSPSSSRSVPVRPGRPISLVIPMENRPRSNSTNTVKLESTPSSPASSQQAAGSIRLRANRVSRTINPASPPPVTPLPSPPTSASFPISSDAEGWSTDASTRLGGWSTDNSTRIGSLASRKSAASLEAARARATTIIPVPARSTAAVQTGSGVSSGGEDSDRSRIRQMTRSTSRGDNLAHCLPSFSIHGRQGEKDKRPEPDRPPDRPRQRALSERARPQALEPPPPQEQPRPSSDGSSGSQGTPTPTREDMQGQSLRAAHETYVRILQEKHAAEKAELIRRIERLERETKKRDREIKGLRWLVLNATSEDGTMSGAQALLALDEKLSGGRLRSTSRSSEWSTPSGSVRSRTSSGHKSRTDQSIANSPDGSTEDGLLELQQEVSDLIAPWYSYSPKASDTEGERPGSPGASLRRSRTLPENDAAAIKQARRSSSPVIPAVPTIPKGLGFDVQDSTSDVSQSSSVPSMTTSTTASTSASSHLSAIPEQPTPTESLFGADVDEKDGSRTARSSVAYAHNLKVGMSPSIGQVLDRGRSTEETNMDDVLRKLRAFSP